MGDPPSGSTGIWMAPSPAPPSGATTQPRLEQARPAGQSWSFWQLLAAHNPLATQVNPFGHSLLLSEGVQRSGRWGEMTGCW
jgi:hypothetical protein